MCSEHFLYNSNAIPSGFKLRGLFAVELGGPKQAADLELSRPIVIDSSLMKHAPVDEAFSPNGLDLVPWKPVGAALALKVYATYLDKSPAMECSSSQQPAVPVSPIFGFEAEQHDDSPPELAHSRPPKPVRNRMRLPSVASKRSPAKPVLDRTVRRSPRLNTAGYSHAWLDREPTKKRKITTLCISDSEGQHGPILIATLQAWGVDCGVAPGELTEEALMQTPSDTRIQDDHA